MKAQVNAVVSTGVDFAATVAFTELCGLWCVTSSALGRVAGGGCNFVLGRCWVYGARDESLYKQVMLFVAVWWVNLVLNVAGMYMMADLLHVNYMFSKIVVAILLGVFVNYLMQKKIVFKIQA